MYEALAAVEHVCGREHYFRMVCLCDEMFRQKEVDRRLQNSAAHFVRLFLSLTEYSLLYFRFVVMFMMRKEWRKCSNRVRRQDLLHVRAWLRDVQILISIWTIWNSIWSSLSKLTCKAEGLCFMIRSTNMFYMSSVSSDLSLWKWMLFHHVSWEIFRMRWFLGCSFVSSLWHRSNVSLQRFLCSRDVSFNFTCQSCFVTRFVELFILFNKHCFTPLCMHIGFSAIYYYKYSNSERHVDEHLCLLCWNVKTTLVFRIIYRACWLSSNGGALLSFRRVFR